MTETEELTLYKKALIDWEKPIKDADLTFTQWGFCYYFYWRGLFGSYREMLPTLASECKGIYRKNGLVYNFREYGDNPEGRQQRVTALKNAIEILENKLKQTENE